MIWVTIFSMWHCRPIIIKFAVRCRYNSHFRLDWSKNSFDQSRMIFWIDMFNQFDARNKFCSFDKSCESSWEISVGLVFSVVDSGTFSGLKTTETTSGQNWSHWSFYWEPLKLKNHYLVFETLPFRRSSQGDVTSPESNSITKSSLRLYRPL